MPDTPGGTPPATPDWKPRSIEQLREVLSMLCYFVWHKTPRPNDHLWTIPVDRERDFDCILSDGISEIEALRAEAEALRQELGDIHRAFDDLSSLCDGLSAADVEAKTTADRLATLTAALGELEQDMRWQCLDRDLHPVDKFVILGWVDRLAALLTGSGVVWRPE